MYGEYFYRSTRGAWLNGEAIVSWWMNRYDLHEDDRDGAIGSLVMFTKGAGQPPTDLFVAFPEMAKAYYSALGK